VSTAARIAFGHRKVSQKKRKYNNLSGRASCCVPCNLIAAFRGVASHPHCVHFNALYHSPLAPCFIIYIYYNFPERPAIKTQYKQPWYSSWNGESGWANRSAIIIIKYIFTCHFTVWRFFLMQINNCVPYTFSTSEFKTKSPGQWNNKKWNINLKKSGGN